MTAECTNMRLVLDVTCHWDTTPHYTIPAPHVRETSRLADTTRWMSSHMWEQKVHTDTCPPRTTKLKQLMLWSTSNAKLAYRVTPQTTCANYTDPMPYKTIHALSYTSKSAHLIRLAFMAFYMLLQIVLHTERLCAAAVGAPATKCTQWSITQSTQHTMHIK